MRSDEGRDDDEEDERRQVQAEAVVEQACGEQQGFTGQHREQDTRLDEDDEHRSPQHPRPHGDEQSLGIFKPLDNGVQHDGSDAVTSVDQVTIGPFSAGNVSP